MTGTIPPVPRGLQAVPEPANIVATNRPPRAPKGLGPDGRKLWHALTDDYDFELQEQYVLLSACRVVDRLQDIAAGLEGAPLTVRNSRGDEVAHPLLNEQRQQQGTFTKLLASLRLPTGETPDGELIRPQRRGGSRAAYGFRSPVGGAS